MVTLQLEVLYKPVFNKLCILHFSGLKWWFYDFIDQKKESNGNLTELASSTKELLDCKLIDGVLSLDRKTIIEVQAALHICSLHQCLVFFMLGSNVGDHLIKVVDKDEGFFVSNVEPKMDKFINEYFLKKVADKHITVKQ